MKIGFIGAGKVGIAIAHALQRKGYVIAAVSDVRGEDAFVAARRYLGEDCFYSSDNLDVVDRADVIAVATQDRAIRDVAAGISARADSLEGKVIFHTSGADPSAILSPLDRKGAFLGSLHPLQTFPDIGSAISVLPETFIFIEGDDGALPVLREIGSRIGYQVKTIKAEDKVLYHLSAVFVCNLLSALYFGAEGVMERIGITLEPFLPIIRATLRNIETKGPLAALTGPIVRGDVETVQSHLAALGDMGLQRKVYCALSQVALTMARERAMLDEDTIRRLRGLLEAEDD
jgi:predicted short-subunit dehydrogenase-like oxidoreductase (DUF2520 family)